MQHVNQDLLGMLLESCETFFVLRCVKQNISGSCWYFWNHEHFSDAVPNYESFYTFCQLQKVSREHGCTWTFYMQCVQNLKKSCF